MNNEIKPIFKESEQYDFISDISLASSELQFKPNTRINEGLEKTIKKFME